MGLTEEQREAREKSYMGAAIVLLFLIFVVLFVATKLLGWRQ